MSNNSNLLFNSPDWGIWSRLKNKKLLVAFSGGKDSLALIKYLSLHQSTGGWCVYACHVNHNLRGAESYRDMEFCERWCNENSISFICKNVDIINKAEYKRGGLEYAARIYRYRSFSDALKETGCDFVLTAHTLDDQLESFFVDLYTGVSIYTAGGIKKQAGNVCRPLLSITSEMINRFLDFHNLTPVYDSSNSDKNFVRNKVRLEVLPALLKEDTSIVNSILRMQKESAELGEWLDVKTSSAVSCEDGFPVIERRLFDTFGLPEKRYLLGKWISRLSRGGAVHVNAVLNLLKNRKSLRINLPSKYCCEITPFKIRVFPSSFIEYEEVKKKKGDAEVVFKNRKLAFSGSFRDIALTVRHRKNGDRYKGVLLKKIFSDKKIDLYHRDTAAVVENENEILWVEHISTKNGCEAEFINTYIKREEDEF